MNYNSHHRHHHQPPHSGDAVWCRIASTLFGRQTRSPNVRWSRICFAGAQSYQPPNIVAMTLSDVLFAYATGVWNFFQGISWRVVFLQLPITKHLLLWSMPYAFWNSRMHHLICIRVHKPRFIHRKLFKCLSIESLNLGLVHSFFQLSFTCYTRFCTSLLVMHKLRNCALQIM